MTKKKDDLPKVFPFTQAKGPGLHPGEPVDPPPLYTSSKSISERGLLSNVTMLLGIGALVVALLGGAKLILDVFNEGLFKSLETVWAKVIALGVTYLFGWLSANLSIRVYNNLVLPLVIRFLTWACLSGVLALYGAIIHRLYRQTYDLPHFTAYLLLTAGSLAALVGLHLILEEHDLRTYAVPLLLMTFVHLALVVHRYLFTRVTNATYLLGDLFFWGAMITFSGLMLAHLGLLDPLRQNITLFFDQNSKVIRPKR